MSTLEGAVVRLRAAPAVLVLRPWTEADDDLDCKRVLVDDPSDVELLGVSFSQTPAAWYDDWRTALGRDPAAAAVITTPALGDTEFGDRNVDVDVETVATPTNLTGVGVKATPYLREWDDAVVAVESLSVLLQYASTRAVYRFLHALTTRIRITGLSGQFYLDPTTLDAQTVDLLTTLFDAVVECDGSADGWTVRQSD
ncbi:hypothetical protein DVK02_08875 [Halobellus sp. Atlit-31R]|nr:hypothetical protein DVK02_08875 [Halobellus sp. Atlit-31R]